jgi:hypothetical protein
MQKTIQLDEVTWGQIIDGLTCRAEWYENAVQYYETGYCEGEVAEVRDEEEARVLAEWYRKTIEEIQVQSRMQMKAPLDKPMWSELPYGNYMETVDYALDLMIGRDSTQEELKFIANMQDENNDPIETALSIVRGERCCCGACPMLTCPDKNVGAEATSNPPS